MKDKEKQIIINEMRDDVGGAFLSVEVDTIEKLYDKGYRKIDEKYVPIDTFVLIKEELEFVKRRLKIKTDEADWRASQLQALDKDFELMEKVCKCKDCKWLEEKHYEEDNEKPYIKLVCKLTKRQCRLYDFCSYGEKKL